MSHTDRSSFLISSYLTVLFLPPTTSVLAIYVSYCSTRIISSDDALLQFRGQAGSSLAHATTFLELLLILHRLCIEGRVDLVQDHVLCMLHGVLLVLTRWIKTSFDGVVDSSNGVLLARQ